MTKDAAHAVRNFAAHIEAQARARQDAVSAGLTFEAPATEKALRDGLMQDLLAALGLTQAELQAKLGIGRATWDRWRAILSIPHRRHLETLARFAAEQSRNNGPELKLPKPHDMLNGGRPTWGRLRLVYSLYPWRNAVLRFKDTFYDDKTATEMALLALRGCSLVYLMSGSNYEKWHINFARNLVLVLGKNYAARALSRFCIVKIAEETDSQMPDFGIFNFETTNSEDCVGYIWKDRSSNRPEDIADNVYEAFPATDDRYTDVRDKYLASIQKALNKIDKNVPHPEDFWSHRMEPELRQKLLTIPFVEE